MGSLGFARQAPVTVLRMTDASSTAMSVDVWSDVVCPWCCIGRAHLETALAQFEHADDVVVTWRSFELDPNAATDQTITINEHLRRKYGISADEVAAMQENVTARAAQAGLEFHLDGTHPTNTFDAHRLLHLAREGGRQDALKGRLFRAYFTEGERIGDPAVLAALAVEAGLDEAAVADVLATDRFADAVRADEEQARAYGVSGVPFYVIDERYGVAGAQPVEHLLAVLQQAWTERVPA